MDIQNIIEIYSRNANVKSLCEYIKTSEGKIYAGGVKASFASVLSAVTAKTLENRQHSFYPTDFQCRFGYKTLSLCPQQPLYDVGFLKFWQ